MLVRLPAWLRRRDTTEWALRVARKYETRSPDAEAVFKTDPTWVYLYARDVIRGRWPEGEAILLDGGERYATYLFHYARDVMARRWEPAEDSLRQNPTVWRAYQHWQQQVNANAQD